MTTEHGVSALADIIWSHMLEHRKADSYDTARAVLASEWLASLLAATADSARADERGRVAEAIAQAIESERSRRWQKHLRDHPYSNGSSCPYDYGEHDGMCAATSIARSIARDGGR